MFQPAEEAVAAALAAGAGYADARVVKAVTERIDVQNGHVRSTSWTEGFGGETWGPSPRARFVESGESSPTDLVADVDTGRYVTAFNYCRVLEPGRWS